MKYPFRILWKRIVCAFKDHDMVKYVFPVVMPGGMYRLPSDDLVESLWRDKVVSPAVVHPRYCRRCLMVPDHSRYQPK